MLTKSFTNTLTGQEQKLIWKIEKQVSTAVREFVLIEPGDKVMVCLSGGKDSYTMLDMLINLKGKVPFNFDIIAVNVDQKQPDFPEHILPEYLSAQGVEFKIIERDTYSIVKEKIEPGKTMCSLCSRLRRGILYNFAKEIKATKIALGHHREDVLETFFLNLFFSGKIETMPPKFESDDKENIVIRPMAYCSEQDILQYSNLRKFPIIPCNLCGSQPNMQRKVIKNMLAEWEKEYPGRTESIFTALHNIHPSHLFDKKLFDFKDLVSNSKYQDSLSAINDL